MRKMANDIYTSFNIDRTEIAIEVKAVQEVVNFPERVIPMPLAPSFLLGVFNLRGAIIPIINLKNLLKYADDSLAPTQKVAIVEIDGAKIGLIFDSTSEILRVSADDISEFGYASEHSHKIISGAIKLRGGDRILQILDTQALITIENVPQILAQQKIHHTQAKHSRLDQRGKCISFLVGGIKMAFEISKIYEIVKAPEIKPSSIQSPIFLGIMNLRGRTIPVVSFAKVLKMEVPCEKETKHTDDQRIIIMKAEKELIGFVVDSVDCINSYYEYDMMVVPLLSKERISMFHGCLNIPNAGEIFLLNHEHVLSGPEIEEVTEGHSKIYQNAEEQVVLKKIDRESYISFRLDHLFGISIKDIKEIINYSDDVLTAPGMPSFVKGMLNLRSKLITIIDTRSLYKMPSEGITQDAKILIFEKDEERFGLVVDSLESIVSIDQDKKFKVPTLLTQKIQDKFQNDIKEIVSIPVGEKEGALIILNIHNVSDRVRNAKAA